MLGQILQIHWRRGLAKVSTARRLLLVTSLHQGWPPIIIPPLAAIDDRRHFGSRARSSRRHRAGAGDDDDDFTIIDVDFGRPDEW